MNFLLFWLYIDTITVLLIAELLILLLWRAYFPKRLLVYANMTFISLIVSLLFLFITEQQAPYNLNFYLNPFFYLMFFFFLGCVFFAEYLIADDMFFKHIRPLFIIGIIGFILMIMLYIISGIILLTTHYSIYPVIVYISFESGYIFGIVACLMFCIGCLKMSNSDRLEEKAQRNMRIVGYLWLINALYHMWLAWGLFFIDFSIALDITLSILTLMWISGEVIIYIIFVRKLIKYLK